MSEFTLTRQPAKLLKMSLREELKNPDGLLDAYLTFRVRVGASVIDNLLTDLSKLLYTDSEQQDIEGDSDGDLRYQELGKLSIKHKIVGANATVHFGIGTSDITSTAQVDTFAVEAMQGGTFVLDFRTWIKPRFEDLANLGRVLGRDTELSIEPPKDPQGSLIDASKDGDWPFPKDAAGNSAPAPMGDD
jgi:hypothetical protein